MNHHHGGVGRNDTGGRALKIALAIVLVIMVAEVVGGILSHSLALIGDAGHMLVDALALGLSLFAVNIAGRPATPSKTYGYHRVEIMAALANGTILLLLSAYIFYEAYQRLLSPPVIRVPVMLLVASIGRVANIVVNISELTDRSGNHLGRVVVLEEITQRIRAEQTMAWREVARRIAHEIKNPLTPIKLSAQRLRKKFADRAPDYEQVFEECTRTIIQEVNGLKGLVDEFSRYAAKMPSSDPKPNDLHLVVEIVMTLYAAVPKGIKIGCDLDPELPLVNVDPEQMKRALINLVDNALDALEGEGGIGLNTRYLKGREGVALEVDDTGPGIPQADRERLFLPYFSTKRGGTGLGLAIVHRIVAEHAGQIRIEDNVPKGTRIIIELPALAHSGGNGDGVGPWPTIRS